MCIAYTCKDNRKTRVSNMHYILSYRHTRYVKAIERQSSFVACCSSLVALRRPARSMLGKGRRIASHMNHFCKKTAYSTRISLFRGIELSDIVVAKTQNSAMTECYVRTSPLGGGGSEILDAYINFHRPCDKYLAWPLMA